MPKHPLSIHRDPHHPTLRHVRLTRLDGTTRLLGSGKSDAEVLLAALSWGGGLFPEEAGALLGCTRLAARELLTSLWRTRRAYQAMGGQWFVGRLTAGWGRGRQRGGDDDGA